MCVHVRACTGVPPGQRASEGSVCEAGRPIGAAGEDLDVLRAHAGPLHRADEGAPPGPAAALLRLHHLQGERSNAASGFSLSEAAAGLGED